ncbi:RNB-domain-containing protein [Microthyrium microscopicum]|uniref:RNB-domain-containing protein n=1 Tax=Microthyrium microscopicum TaxID=703497 RepID=A0A6A6U6Q1_9PEZI|nr:RNB-domain-containing protein [Microthyrium microscopicum]
MDPNAQPGPTGLNGRRLHIAHRRSPSELTPLMIEHLQMSQTSDFLQPQQHMPHQQYVNMGLLQPQQQMQGFPMQGQMHQNFQMPQGMPQQHLAVPMNAPTQPSAHRRNQSAAGMGSMGPPPAPQGLYTYPEKTELNTYYSYQGRENANPRGGRGNANPPGGGHARRHSLALPEAKKAAEAAEQKRKNANFQFPGPGGETNSQGSSSSPTNSSVQPQQPQQQQQGSYAPRGRGTSHGRSQSMAVGSRGSGNGRGGFQFPANDSNSNQNDFARRGSHGHGRSGSRNFDGNWRQPQNNQNNQEQPQHGTMGNFTANAPPFQPGHRSRGSVNQSMGSIGNFQYPGQPQLVQLPQGQFLMPQMFGTQALNQLQLAQLQMQMGGQMGMAGSQHAPQMSMGGNQQQRKTLFTPYLPQATLPALLGDGQLVQGILRVNKKNRSDAYVTTNDLDADIFICGSKDRNRALEGDLVAIELLDVDEVWGQKREKEEKKKRKDGNDGRASTIAVNDATTQPESASEGGLRRRGSLRQRPTQKKNDDVEVEGQSLLLMEEEEINDEQKPLYAGHVVAVIERVAGQMFSGTLGLLRPSSQATKEKQEAERAAREGSHHRQPERQQERPKIVWFKPTDKRVPLIAIPTEQAPRDFVERHQDYANKIFVACIKRWPITSLHPFGTLVESLGDMGDLKVETDALLRDNNFGPDEFAEAVSNNVGHDQWSVEADGEAATQERRDFRNDPVLTVNPHGIKELDNAVHFKILDDGHAEIAIHVADVAHFVKANSLVDREARKRGTAVYLTNRTVNLLPPRLSTDILCLKPGEDRYTVSIVFKVDLSTGRVLDDETWIGKGIIKSTGLLSYEDVDSVLSGRGSGLNNSQAEDVKKLNSIIRRWRQARYGDRSEVEIPALRLVYQLDDENVPPENNIFNSSPAHELIEEICCKANYFVANKLHEAMPEKAFLRRQDAPNMRRLQTFHERMNGIGLDIDTESSGSLQNSIFKIEDDDTRKGVETLLIKTMQRGRYYVAGRSSEDKHAHYALNLPVYTHFTHPTRRYADVLVHRQLDSVLAGNPSDFAEDVDSLAKAAEMCTTKKDSAHFAQEQSVHIDACRMMDKKAREIGGDLIAEGIVVCVYESAFDVLIPEWGFEKRVHCDQLPLKKAEFDKHTRLLELFWEKGVPSSAYVPEDEQPKANSRGNNNQATAQLHREQEAAKQREKEAQEAKRRQLDTGSMATDEADALFDDDEDTDVADMTEMTAGVSLASHDRPTQSMPPSPTKNGMRPGGAPHRTKSDSKLSQSAGDHPETKLSNKDKYLSMFTLREEGSNYIQEVREMTRVPIILKTDLSKSPPCLTIRSVNPFAL